MKFRVPPHCAALVHDGVPFVVAADGSIEADEALMPLLHAHGVVPWAKPTRAAAPQNPMPRDVDSLSRGEVLAALARLGRPRPPPTSTADLRRMLRQVLAARA